MSESVLVAAARVDAIGGAGAPFAPLNFPDRPARSHVEVARDAVEKSAIGTVLDAKLEALDWEGAQREVNRAIARGGRDPLAPQATDTQAMRSIAELLIRVRLTKDGAPDAALHAALERGEAVAKAIAGNA